jgi:hypothetical protein
VLPVLAIWNDGRSVATRVDLERANASSRSKSAKAIRTIWNDALIASCAVVGDHDEDQQTEKEEQQLTVRYQKGEAADAKSTTSPDASGRRRCSALAASSAATYTGRGARCKPWTPSALFVSINGIVGRLHLLSSRQAMTFHKS